MVDEAWPTEIEEVLRQLRLASDSEMKWYDRAFLVYWGYADQARRGELTPADLRAVLLEAHETWPPIDPNEWTGAIDFDGPPLLPPAVSLPADNEQLAHTYAASKILAARASRLRQVIEFRRQFVGHELLAFQQVDAWIQTTAQQDGPPSFWLFDAPVSGATIIDHRDAAEYTTVGPFRVPTPWQPQNHEPRLEQKELEYFVFSRRHPQRVKLAARGVLEQLAFLADDLLNEYNWNEPQAVNFVLTGMVPRLNVAAPLLMRVSLNATVEEVTEMFKNARRMLVGARGRPLSMKSLHLAVFASQRAETESSARRMKAWNLAYPDWSYNHAGHFAQESSDAIRRLLREKAPEPPAGARRRRKTTRDASNEISE